MAAAGIGQEHRPARAAAAEGWAAGVAPKSRVQRVGASGVRGITLYQNIGDGDFSGGMIG